MTKFTDIATASSDQELLDRLPHDLIERMLHLADMRLAFLQDLLATGVPDRARLRESLEAYGRLRLDILNCLGADPQSEELMPLPVTLHDS